MVHGFSKGRMEFAEWDGPHETISQNGAREYWEETALDPKH